MHLLLILIYIYLLHLYLSGQHTSKNLLIFSLIIILPIDKTNLKRDEIILGLI